MFAFYVSSQIRFVISAGRAGKIFNLFREVQEEIFRKKSFERFDELTRCQTYPPQPRKKKMPAMNTTDLTSCASIDAYQAARPDPSESYIGASWFLFVFSFLLWGSSVPFFWTYRQHPRLSIVRPLGLNMLTVVSNLTWTLMCLNLVVKDMPCFFMPWCLITGMAVCAVNFSLKLAMFAIESQFARNAHLLKASKESSDVRSEDSRTYGVSYVKSMLALMMLMLGVTTLENVGILEIAKAKQSKMSLMFISLFPGLIALIAVLASNSQIYFHCVNCPMTPDSLWGFIGMALGYAVITGRCIYVCYVANFPDDKEILYELRMSWLFTGVPLLVVAIFWLADINQGELHRSFAYEWIAQVLMIVFWWWVVGDQMRMVYKQNRSAKHTPVSNSVLHRQLSESDLRDPDFDKYMVRQFAVENLYFLQDVSAFKRYYSEKNASWRKQKSRIIYETYIKPGAAMEVNTSDTVRENISNDLSRMDPSDFALGMVFDLAVADVRNNIVNPMWIAFEHKRGGNNKHNDSGTRGGAAAPIKNSSTLKSNSTALLPTFSHSTLRSQDSI